MQTFQISVNDNDSALFLQILRNLKMVQDVKAIQATQDEHEAWTFSSAQTLNNAYSDQEPDYTNISLKTKNPHFKP